MAMWPLVSQNKYSYWKPHFHYSKYFLFLPIISNLFQEEYDKFGTHMTHVYGMYGTNFKTIHAVIIWVIPCVEFTGQKCEINFKYDEIAHRHEIVPI